MRLFEIKSINAFMRVILLKDLFDDFSFINGEIVTSFAAEFDGKIIKDFEEEVDVDNDKFIKYSAVRPLFLQIIKGQNTPKLFKLILAVSKTEIESFIEENKDELGDLIPTGLFVNMRFEKENLILSSGCSCAVFDREKIVDRLWDLKLSKLLQENELL